MSHDLIPSLLLENADFVRGLARHLLQDEAQAEDVAQETWLVAVQKAPRDPSRLRGWLGRITRNFAFEQRRTEARRRRREEAAAKPESLPSPEEILEREALRRRVVEAVMALDEPYRMTVLLRFFEDLPPRAIARRLDVPVETVKTRLRRAFEKLRVTLQDERPDRRQLLLGLAGLAGLRTEATATAASGAMFSLGGLLVSTPFKIASVSAVVLAGFVLLWAPWDGETPSPLGPAVGETSRLQPAERIGSAAPALESLERAADPAPPAEPATAPPPAEQSTDLRTEGVVRYPDGQPFARARVEYSQAGRWATNSVKSDSDGVFAFVTKSREPLSLVAFDEERQFAPATLQDLAPGSRDVVLQFPGPPQRLRIEVIDQQGAPNSQWAAVAHRADGQNLLGQVGAIFDQPGFDPAMLAEKAAILMHMFADQLLDAVSEGRDPGRWSYPWYGIPSHEDGAGELHVPWMPFQILVKAKGFVPAHRGPFDPADLPDVVQVTLESQPHFGGVVIADGASVPNAIVKVFRATCPKCVAWVQGLPVRHHGVVSFETRTDHQGRFDVPVGEPGRYVLRAESEEHAPGDIGPIELDPSQPRSDLRIELQPPGAIEGSVHVPAHLDAEAVVITARRGDAFARYTPIEPDGSYRFEGLTPGGWRVEPRERDVVGRSSPNIGHGHGHDLSDHRAGDPDIPPFQPNVEVQPSRTIRLDVDLGAAFASIRGALILGGVPQPGWKVEPQSADRLDRFLVPTATTDAEGEFAIDQVLATRKTMILTRETPVETQRIEEVIDLQGGASRWVWDIPTGRLAGSCGSDPELPWIHYEWIGAGQRRGGGARMVGAETSFMFENVPAGEIALWRNRSSYPGKNGELTTVTVRAGETTQVDLD